MAAQALLFDLDGTIWDSRPFYAAVLASCGSVTEREIEQQLAGGAIVVKVMQDCGVSRSRFTAACSDLAPELRLYPGVRETLLELSGRALGMAIVTNLPRWIVIPLLDGAELIGLFSDIRCAARKPSGGPIRQALAALGVRASPQAFYVGDTQMDAECASEAGISFAWASYGYGQSRPEPTAAELAEFSEALQL